MQQTSILYGVYKQMHYVYMWTNSSLMIFRIFANICEYVRVYQFEFISICF